MKRTLNIVFMLLTLVPGSIYASRGSSMEQRSPHDEAILDYNDGLSRRDKAWKLEQKMASTTDQADKAKLQEKIVSLYSSAARTQRMAVKADPNLFQAWSELGYALRKSGDYTGALASYERALSLQPNYAEAIEYRAEAYLGLGRVDEAQQSYLALFNGGDNARAQLLGSAMQRWVEERRVNPGDIPPEKVIELTAWLAQRNEIAKSATAGGGSW